MVGLTLYSLGQNRFHYGSIENRIPSFFADLFTACLSLEAKYFPPSLETFDEAEFHFEILCPHLYAFLIQSDPSLQQRPGRAGCEMVQFMLGREDVQRRRRGMQLYRPEIDQPHSLEDPGCLPCGDSPDKSPGTLFLRDVNILYP